MTAAENKTPSINNLVKKTDYDRKVSEIEKKLTDHKQNEYITTTEFNATLVQANLVTKTDFDNKFSSLNRKTVSNKTKDIALQMSQVIFAVKIILMKMVYKIIIYFNQFLNI